MNRDRNVDGSGTAERLHLILYVSDETPNSLAALRNVRAALREDFGGRGILEILDVNEEPLRALADGVVVTPTLIRLEPKPVVVVVGDLGDRDRLRAALAARTGGA